MMVRMQMCTQVRTAQSYGALNRAILESHDRQGPSPRSESDDQVLYNRQRTSPRSESDDQVRKSFDSGTPAVPAAYPVSGASRPPFRQHACPVGEAKSAGEAGEVEVVSDFIHFRDTVRKDLPDMNDKWLKRVFGKYTSAYDRISFEVLGGHVLSKTMTMKRAKDDKDDNMIIIEVRVIATEHGTSPTPAPGASGEAQEVVADAGRTAAAG